MPCLNVGLTLESLPELCGDYSILGSGIIPTSPDLSASGYAVANGSAKIATQVVVIGLGIHSYHGGQATIAVKAEVACEGLRQSHDVAIPINFQKDFY